ncbi:MAG TPA: metalloregulator ArsR/SmtB family transcription factor [Steroidobacteraceae bacterium]|jgi:DNA-binding transcriptional ArsR family regulator|nr:metalloregulator ArsR/SmtB family transcription factor [Steroidobacteraceae bacterium]
MQHARRSPAPTSLAGAAPAFAALGHATRLRIVMRLSQDGPLSISRLTDESQLTRQAITKHLRALEAAQLVSCERRGRQCIWQLRQSRLRDVRAYLEQISGHWDAALERLRLLVERGKP